VRILLQETALWTSVIAVLLSAAAFILIVWTVRRDYNRSAKESREALKELALLSKRVSEHEAHGDQSVIFRGDIQKHWWPGPSQE
jgi:hypothetical protein